MGELGRYPLLYNAWCQSIKYWLRLCAGTKNNLLNEAYRLVLSENLDWIQSIQYLLCKNGLKNMWLNPNEVDKIVFITYSRCGFMTNMDRRFFQKYEIMSVLASLKSDFDKSG